MDDASGRPVVIDDGQVELDEFFETFLVDGPDRRYRPDGPVAQWLAWWRASVADDPVSAHAARQGFVLSPAQLESLGVSRGQRRWLVRAGHWTDVTRGAVAPVDLRHGLPTHGAAAVLARRHHALLGAAAFLRRPGSAITGRTAAVMHGLPVLTIPPAPEVTTRAVVGMGRRAAALLFAAPLDASQEARWFGVTVSDVARTIVDVARADPRSAVMAVDAALREAVVSPPELDRALTLASRWPGMARARNVMALADPRSESPLESLTRLALHDSGFPAPELQAWLGRDRVDFFWPHYRLVLEADGRLKYTDDQLWREKKREQRLRALGVTVERVTWDDVVHRWPTTQQALRRAFA